MLDQFQNEAILQGNKLKYEIKRIVFFQEDESRAHGRFKTPSDSAGLITNSAIIQSKTYI